MFVLAKKKLQLVATHYAIGQKRAGYDEKDSRNFQTHAYLLVRFICPICFGALRSLVYRRPFIAFINSGFPSTRINLSPFTNDFRGGERLNESS